MIHEALQVRYHALPPWTQTMLRVVAVVALGYLVLSLLRRYAGRVLARSRRIDATLRGFVVALITTGGWIALVVAALGTAGVDLAALVGGLAIGGFIVGFALKDVLGNLAAGVMLLFYRPFNVGDFVTISGHDGSVRRLDVSMTTLQMPDGRIVTLPNGGVLGGPIVNHTRNPVRRVDVTLSVGHQEDTGAVLRLLLDAVGRDPRVLPDPAPGAAITRVTPEGFDLLVMAWVPQADFGVANTDLKRAVREALGTAGISIPAPVQQVHLQRPEGTP